jgi:hypothetical protein
VTVVDEPVTRAEVHRLIAKAFAAERKANDRLLTDFSDASPLRAEAPPRECLPRVGRSNKHHLHAIRPAV